MRTVSFAALVLAAAFAVRADEAAPGRLPLVYRGMMGDTAVVEDLETTTQESYRVGDQIRDAKVVAFTAKDLTLELAGKRIVLAMGDSEAAEAALRTAAGSIPLSPWVVPEWARKQDRLYRETVVDLDFAAASLEDAIAFLREFTGTSLLLDPAAQQRTRGPYSFTIKRVSVREALERLLTQFGLGLAYQDKVAVITSAEKAAQNPVVKAFAAEAGLAEARRILDRVSESAPPEVLHDKPLADQLGRFRVTATFDDASLADAIEFLHATTGLNFLIDGSVDPTQEAYRVSAGVKDALLRDFLDDILRARDLGWVLRRGFVVVKTAAALEAEEAQRGVDAEARLAREDKDDAVLQTACTLSFQSEPLYQVALVVAETTGVPVVIEPGLWGPTPKFTYAGGKTLQDLVDALDSANDVRHVTLRGTIYLLQ